MRLYRFFLTTAATAIVLTIGIVAQQPATAGAGTLTGTVTADSGDVRALRVKARNTATRVAYTVFTVKGRYQIHNLPSGPYEVQVVEEAFESPVQKVQLADGIVTVGPPCAASGAPTVGRQAAYMWASGRRHAAQGPPAGPA